MQLGIDFGYSSTKVVILDKGRIEKRLILLPGIVTIFCRRFLFFKPCHSYILSAVRFHR